jgi:hypothetical protein
MAAQISYTNLADTAPLLTASTNTLLLPASNLSVPHIARKWRGTDTVTDYFVCDLGAATSLDTVAVFGITGKQIRVRVSSVDATGVAGDLYDSGVLSVDQNYLASICLVPAAVSGRYVRVDLTTDAGTYVEAGRLFIGSRTRFAYNFVKGWHRVWTDRSTKSKTRGGQTQIFADNTFRSIDVTFDFLSQTDRDGFVEEIDRVNATKTDVLFITDPNSTNLARDSIWGLISAMTPVVQPYAGVFTKQYMIEERL